jgi:hypothetical protein
MKRFTIYFILAISIVSCTKSKFKTQPQVQNISLSPNSVYYGQIFKLKATVTDKEGDATDSVYLVEKWYSIPANFLLKIDTIPYTTADFGVPNNDQYEFEADFDFGQNNVPGTIYAYSDDNSVDRNFSVGIIIRDKAGHKSDYVESNKIILQKL